MQTVGVTNLCGGGGMVMPCIRPIGGVRPRCTSRDMHKDAPLGLLLVLLNTPHWKVAGLVCAR